MCFGGSGGGRSTRLAANARAGMAQRRQVGSVSTKTVGEAAGPREYFKNPETKQMDPGYKRTGRAVSGRAMVLQVQKQKRQQQQGNTGYQTVQARPGYESGYDEQGRLFQQKKSTLRTETTADNLGRTAVGDEAGLRIKTRAARSQVANVEDNVKKKSKKRGGLRLDRSTGTNSRGSGVVIPK